MKQQPVALSAIPGVGYDVEKHLSEVGTLCHGTLPLSGVPQAARHFLIAARSGGLFFYQHIKHRYHQL